MSTPAIILVTVSVQQGLSAAYAYSSIAARKINAIGGIEQKWLSFGGLQGKLGHPVSNETPTFDGVGRFQNFQKGIISWNPRPEMGAHVIWGLIGERWLQIGREQFGYPLTDEEPASDGNGRFNHFRAFKPDGSLIGESSIFWLSETGAHEVYGAQTDQLPTNLVSTSLQAMEGEDSQTASV